MSVETMIIVAQWAYYNHIRYEIRPKEDHPKWTIILFFTPDDQMMVEEFKKYRSTLLLPCGIDIIDDKHWKLLETLQKGQYAGDNYL